MEIPTLCSDVEKIVLESLAAVLVVFAAVFWLGLVAAVEGMVTVESALVANNEEAVWVCADDAEEAGGSSLLMLKYADETCLTPAAAILP